MKTHVTSHFQKADPLLFAYIEKITAVEDLVAAHPDSYFISLVRSIVYQQLAGRAAEVIFSRFLKLFPKEHITPEKVVALDVEKMRSAGLSYSKAAYIKNIAAAFLERADIFKSLHLKTDEEVILELTKIKGVGRWTAEMFLMFTLGREDLFSHGDLGLRRGIQKIYGFKKEPSKRTIERIVKKWSPYRTYACRILWGSLEVK